MYTVYMYTIYTYTVCIHIVVKTRYFTRNKAINIVNVELLQQLKSHFHVVTLSFRYAVDHGDHQTGVKIIVVNGICETHGYTYI